METWILLEPWLMWIAGGLVAILSGITARFVALEIRTAKLKPRPDATLPIHDRIDARLKALEAEQDRASELRLVRSDVARILSIVERRD